MLSSRLNHRLDKFLDWMVRLVVKDKKIAPNILTIVGLPINLAAAASFAFGRMWLGGLLILAAGLFDMLDGAVARVSGSDTEFGGFLDSVIDRYSDLGILMGLVIFYSLGGETLNLILVFVILVGSVLTSYIRAKAESIISVKCNVGLVERPERIILLAAGALSGFMPVSLWILAFLTNITALQRIHFTWKEIRNSKLERETQIKEGAGLE